VAGPLWLARHWPLLPGVESLVGGPQFALPSLTRKGDLGGRSHAGCPSTSSEAAGGALLRFTPRPRSAPRSAARFPLAGASVPVAAIESCEHRKWTYIAGGDLQPDLRHRAARSLPPSGPRRTTSRSPSLTPRSKNPRRAGPFSAPIVPHPPPGPRFPAETGSLFGGGPTAPGWWPFAGEGSRKLGHFVTVPRAITPAPRRQWRGGSRSFSTALRLAF